jgi:hypothetical protein
MLAVELKQYPRIIFYQKDTARRRPANERVAAAAAAAPLLPRRVVQPSRRHAAHVNRSSEPSFPSLLSSAI